MMELEKDLAKANAQYPARCGPTYLPGRLSSRAPLAFNLIRFQWRLCSPYAHQFLETYGRESKGKLILISDHHLGPGSTPFIGRATMLISYTRSPHKLGGEDIYLKISSLERCCWVMSVIAGRRNGAVSETRLSIWAGRGEESGSERLMAY